MKDYPECKHCRMKDDEPHVCDICDGADMFEPYESDNEEWGFATIMMTCAT